MSRLNFGCGPEPIEGWTNTDIRAYDNESIDVADVLEGLPYETQQFDYCVAHHALQTIEYTGLGRTLQELRRVLKPNGVLRISVPDPLRAIEAWRIDERQWFPVVNEAESTSGGKLCAYLTWYGEARTVFTRAWLCELLLRWNFLPAVTVPGLSIFGPDGICELDSRPTESIYVEGLKA